MNVSTASACKHEINPWKSSWKLVIWIEDQVPQVNKFRYMHESYSLTFTDDDSAIPMRLLVYQIYGSSYRAIVYNYRYHESVLDSDDPWWIDIVKAYSIDLCAVGLAQSMQPSFMKLFTTRNKNDVWARGTLPLNKRIWELISIFSFH